MPQVIIGFDVADAAAVGSAAEEIEQAGYELVHPPRTEPSGQTVARLQSPEGVIVGMSYIPVVIQADAAVGRSFRRAPAFRRTS